MNNISRINKFKKSHYILNLSKPLFQNTPMKYFFHLTINKDQSYKLISPEYKNLSNAHQFVQSFYKKNLSIIEYFTENTLLNVYKHVWKNTNKDLANYFFNQFSVNHFFNIMKKKDEKNIEIFIFATDLECYDITNYYLNYSDMLERFSFYFSNELTNLNLKMKSGHLDSFTNTNDYEGLSNIIDSNFSLIDFAEQTHVKKCIINCVNGEEILLTRRQLQCLYYLTQGKTAKEIANIYNISYRTVEAHLQILRSKLSAFGKSDTIKYLQYDVKNFIETGFKYRNCA